MRGIAIGLLLCAGPVLADSLHGGATELGLAGSLVSSGSAGTVSNVAMQVSRFRSAGGSLVALGAELGYRHVGNIGDLDIVRGTLHLSLLPATGASSAYPFVSVLGGVQYERTGSFGQTRYPLGTGLGVRSLLGDRAALRTEYRYARIVDRDVSSFNEHTVLVGIAVYFGNHAE